MWGHDVKSRDNYIIMSKHLGSAILDFKIFLKRQKTAQNYAQNLYNSTKNLKEEKIVELKFIFINGNTKITNLEKHVCQNDVAKFQKEQPIPI